MKWEDIEFTMLERTINHIEKHNVTIEEIKEILQNTLIYVVLKKQTKRYKIIGRNNSGRILIVIVEDVQWNTFFIVTSYDAGEKDKTLYRRKVN